MMDQLKEMFKRFQNIQMSYEGKNTNWTEKADELNVLVSITKGVKIQHTKNAVFYEWIKGNLIKEIIDEHLRVRKMTFELK